MAIDRARRDAMLQAAAATWGEEAAQTLAEHLEPDGERLASQDDVRGLVVAMNTMDTRIDQRMAHLESRFDGLESRFDGLESRFDGLESRFAGVESRFSGVELRFDNLESRFDLKLDKTAADITASFERGIAAAVNHQTKTLVFSQLGALLIFASIVIGVG